MKFSSPINAEAFAHALIEGVNEKARSLSPSSFRGEYTLWTYAVKEWLKDTAAENDCYAIYTEKDKTNEFMLDLVWWKHGKPSSALLACESEWGNRYVTKQNWDMVAKDFDKLLSFKAPFKLMIFEAARDSEDEQKTVAELNRYLAEYDDHRETEQYLLVNITNDPAAWHCQILANGPNPALNFQPIEMPSRHEA